MEVEIGTVSTIPPGEGRNFIVAGPNGPVRVAVFHTRGGAVFATQPECPHRGGPLADGLIDERTVVCPLHDRAYDFTTGEGVANECSIRTYKVRLSDDGGIVLALDSLDTN